MKFLSVLFALVIITSCKEPLDFNNSQFYDVEEILESSNCSASCEEVADCESQRVKVIGTIDPSNINSATFQFYVLDRTNDRVSMEVKVDSVIAPQLFAKILDKGGEQARVQGVLEGFDAGTNTNCERMIFMNVDNPDDVEVIE